MAVQSIIEYPDPRLREVSSTVVDFDETIAALAVDLIDTLHASSAIGLCAAQIDRPLKMLVMDHSADRSAPEIFINPEILAKDRYGFVEERCLSVPGISVNVFRPTRIQVRYRDLNGDSVERLLEGMPAVCLQHERDHFDGKLLVDRLNWFRRRRFRASIAKAARTGSSPADDLSGLSA